MCGGPPALAARKRFGAEALIEELKMGSLDHIVFRYSPPRGPTFDGEVRPEGWPGNALAGLERGLPGRSEGYLNSEWRDSVVPGVPHFYASPYQRTYDPDPGEPASCEPAYLPHRVEMPAHSREQPLTPPSTLRPDPELRQVEYDDLPMTDQLFARAMHELPPPPVELPDRNARSAAEELIIQQMVAELESRANPGWPDAWP